MAKERRLLTYTERADQASCALGSHLFGLMAEKETNLCVALDESDPDRFLTLAATLGPEIAVLKTHVDTIDQYSGRITVDLSSLAREHNFLIFEDRKFADIGQTVKRQYTKGIFNIIEWADIVNAHALPGPGLIDGLREEVEKHELIDKRGLLLLAQMSSASNLIDDDYTTQVVKLAKANADFVMGFVGADAKRLPDLVEQAPAGFVIFSPGVRIAGGRDQLGQRFTDPATLVNAGADVLVVGRGIIHDDDPLAAAQRYRERCWEAYQERLAEPKVAKR